MSGSFQCLENPVRSPLSRRLAPPPPHPPLTQLRHDTPSARLSLSCSKRPVATESQKRTVERRQRKRSVIGLNSRLLSRRCLYGGNFRRELNEKSGRPVRRQYIKPTQDPNISRWPIVYTYSWFSDSRSSLVYPTEDGSNHPLYTSVVAPADFIRLNK